MLKMNLLSELYECFIYLKSNKTNATLTGTIENYLKHYSLLLKRCIRIREIHGQIRIL